MDTPEHVNKFDQGWNDAVSGIPIADVCNSDYLRGYITFSVKCSLAYEESEEDSIDPHLTDGVTIFLL